jgi:hypothetical protein
MKQLDLDFKSPEEQAAKNKWRLARAKFVYEEIYRLDNEISSAKWKLKQAGYDESPSQDVWFDWTKTEEYKNLEALRDERRSRDAGLAALLAVDTWENEELVEAEWQKYLKKSNVK